MTGSGLCSLGPPCSSEHKSIMSRHIGTVIFHPRNLWWTSRIHCETQGALLVLVSAKMVTWVPQDSPLTLYDSQASPDFLSPCHFMEQVPTLPTSSHLPFCCPNTLVTTLPSDTARVWRDDEEGILGLGPYPTYILLSSSSSHQCQSMLVYIYITWMLSRNLSHNGH